MGNSWKYRGPSAARCLTREAVLDGAKAAYAAALQKTGWTVGRGPTTRVADNASDAPNRERCRPPVNAAAPGGETSLERRSWCGCMDRTPKDREAIGMTGDRPDHRDGSRHAASLSTRGTNNDCSSRPLKRSTRAVSSRGLAGTVPQIQGWTRQQ
jgi:hypothetical protein